MATIPSTSTTSNPVFVPTQSANPDQDIGITTQSALNRSTQVAAEVANQKIHVTEQSKTSSTTVSIKNGSDFIRVTTSLGKSSSAGGLSSEEAIKIYESISKML